MKLEKVYESSKYEKTIYKQWEESGYFNPDNLPNITKKSKSFCITMPPPNTTGVLHLGHASSLAYEDLMVRFKRLQGFKTLFVPGTDHAAIATQNKVEKLLVKEGVKRQDLGRDRFIKRVKEFVKESQGTIKEQTRRMGASCDWSREAYTFDEVSSRVVSEVFIKMYKDGLIYRGDRIVNWCTRCQSTLADDEVEYVEKKSSFYYLKYGPIVIGTARPETKFQDKVIIVHPDDKRYSKFVGKRLEVPWINGTVNATVIADRAANPDIGTGAMTITPAHSLEDFNLAQKYKLDIIQIINADGTITEAGGEFGGLTVNQARTKVVAVLKKKGLLDKIDTEYVHNVSVCYRCQTPIQPLISRQWFVDVNKKIAGGKSLRQAATDIVRRGDIEIIPDRFRKVYFHWMNNLHDWCISRQIWWGHRPPVWYCKTCHDNPKKYAAGDYWVVSMTKPRICQSCGQDTMHQDTDTLDTWFSSATWTFSTLLNRDHKKFKTWSTWLKGSPDLKEYHPTDILETGYDIIFFWVARMILVTNYVLKEKPFSYAYLHGMIRDRKGRKMSKSLDNGIDPNKMIDKYGADALRLSLVIGAAPGQDLNLYDDKIAGYRNFVNKLWNISRYVLQSVESMAVIAVMPQPKTLADNWILEKWNILVADVTSAMENMNFSHAGDALYKFTWQDLADWYIEIAKIESQNSKVFKKNKDEILQFILQRLLVLWHPFAPYVTEKIWSEFKTDQLLMVAAWPIATKIKKSSMQTQSFSRLQALVTSIRNARAENKISASDIVLIKLLGTTDWSNEQVIIEKLTRSKIDNTITSGYKIKGAGFQVLMKLSAKVAANDTKKIEAYIKKLEAKLSNKDFLDKAPKEIIAVEKKKLAEARAKLR